MAAVTRVTVDGKPIARPDRRWYHERPKTAYEAIEAGMAIYVRSDGKYAKARANAVGTAKVFAIAATTVKAGDALTGLMRGCMTGFSGLTPGSTIYLSTATAGEMQDNVPSGTGNAIVPLGVAATASEIEFSLPFMTPAALP